jgi:hypothetical protein
MAPKLYPVESGGEAPPAYVPRDEARCEALYQCWRMGQISASQWRQHLLGEPGLADYVTERAP